MTRRLPPILGALALAAPAACDCSGIVLADDVGVDAWDAGEPPPDTGLAPRCDERPEVCLRAENTATFEVNRYLYSPGSSSPHAWPDYVLHGLSASGPDGPALLGVLPVPSDEPGGCTDVPVVRRFDAAGHPAADADEFEEMELHPPYEGLHLRGDVVRLADGSTLAVWRVPVVELPRPAVVLLRGFRTEAYRVEGGETRPVGIFPLFGESRADEFIMQHAVMGAEAPVRGSVWRHGRHGSDWRS
jgi:hypothetical protein